MANNRKWEVKEAKFQGMVREGLCDSWHLSRHLNEMRKWAGQEIQGTESQRREHAKALRPTCTQVCLAYGTKASVNSRVSNGESGREGAVSHTKNLGFHSEWDRIPLESLSRWVPWFGLPFYFLIGFLHYFFVCACMPVACGILVPLLGIEPMAPGRWSLNLWTTGEVWFTLLKESPWLLREKVG